MALTCATNEVPSRRWIRNSSDQLSPFRNWPRLARAASINSGAANTFVGYDALESTTKIVALYADGVGVAALNNGQTGTVVLDTTGRYAIPLDQEADREEWERFLMLLSRYRRRETQSTFDVPDDVEGTPVTSATASRNTSGDNELDIAVT